MGLGLPARPLASTPFRRSPTPSTSTAATPRARTACWHISRPSRSSRPCWPAPSRASATSSSSSPRARAQPRRWRTRLLPHRPRPDEEGVSSPITSARTWSIASSIRPTSTAAPKRLIAVYAYSLQLYFDFSGYTDIARGVGLLLGIRLPINFDRPYLSANVTEFWRRWHITLLQLAARLSLFLAARQAHQGHAVHQPGHHHGAGRPVARHHLDLRHLGPAARRARWPPPASGNRSRGREPECGVCNRPRRSPSSCTYQFVCLTWMFFRAASSLADALALLGRIASLTFGLENVSWPLAAVMLLGRGRHVRPQETAIRAVIGDLRAAVRSMCTRRPSLLVAVALQLLGGRGSAPFVYSRF